MFTNNDRRQISVIVILVVLLGLILRIWYAVEAPRAGRFVDEKYSLLNVHSIVTEGTLEPASSYYPYPFFNVPPAALVAASNAGHRWTGDDRFRTWTDQEFAPTTYLTCRLIQVLYGTIGLLLVFLIGRRIFSSEAGLIGAFALAFAPWHIHASGYFKPDAQLTTMILLAFYWSLAAIDRSDWKRYLLAGVGIALAMSSKLTGGVVAVPLVVGVLMSGWRDIRRWALLVVSGVSSLVIFVLLNPYWRWYPTWLGGLERDYAMRATRQGMTRFQIPGRVVEMITDPYVLGPVLGTVSLIALVALVAGSARAGTSDSHQRVKRWMFVVFPVAYIAAYAWKTAYFKANNFLPVVPFACLLSGWAVVEIWRLTAVRLPWFRQTSVRLVGVAVLCCLLVPSGVLYVYRSVTPTTLDAALAFVRKGMRPASGRVVFVETVPFRRPGWEGARRFGGGRSAIERVDRLEEVSVARLDLADAEIFPESKLRGERSAFYQDRRDRASEALARLIEPRLFVRRGATMVAVKRAGKRRGEVLPLAVRSCRPRKRCFEADLPQHLEGSEWISLVVKIGFARGTPVDDIVSIAVGQREIPLLLASASMRNAAFVTERFTLDDSAVEIRFQTRKRLVRRRQITIDLHRWGAKDSRH